MNIKWTENKQKKVSKMNKNVQKSTKNEQKSSKEFKKMNGKWNWGQIFDTKWTKTTKSDLKRTKPNAKTPR